jgi:Fur family ferric uptake transcriptional regulator
MPNTALDREVERRLAEHEVRYTRGRHQVVATLAAAGGPLSAAELYEQVNGSLPLSSIYRSLTVLEEAGILAPHNSAKGLTRYELAEWLKGHHHHLVCVECGSVEDVAVTDQQEAEVDSLVTEMSRTASFSPINHVLEIEGRCSRCQ